MVDGHWQYHGAFRFLYDDPFSWLHSAFGISHENESLEVSLSRIHLSQVYGCSLENWPTRSHSTHWGRAKFFACRILKRKQPSFITPEIESRNIKNFRVGDNAYRFCNLKETIAVFSAPTRTYVVSTENSRFSDMLLAVLFF